MKAVKTITLSIFLMFTIGCVTTTGQVNYTNILQAEGILKWQLEDLEGNILRKGIVEDGEWKTGGGILVDVLILEKDTENNITVALLPLGEQSGRIMVEFPFQVYVDGMVYPDESWASRYTFFPDAMNRYDENNPAIMPYSWGATSSAYRSMSGLFPNSIVIFEDSSIHCQLGDSYVFRMSGPTAYTWIK